MNRENRPICVVFPLGMEAYPFLRRVEVRSRRTRNKAVYRSAFFEGRLISVVKCGVGPERAAQAIRHLNEKPAAIVCAGTAGALVGDLKTYDMVISAETVFGDAPESVIAWPLALAEAAGRACHAEGLSHRLCRMATVREAVFDRRDREQLHSLTGAVAVDMESHALGDEARRQGIPFVAIRVISDDVDSLGPERPQRLMTSVRSPGELADKLMARYRTRVFMKKFRTAIGLLHPVLVRFIRNSDRLLSDEVLLG
jgi:adenosylhomocysteine nucleosidase